MTTLLDGRPAVHPAHPVLHPATGLPKAGQVRFVDVPARRYFAIEGEGAPAGEGFTGAVGALYGASYALHFLLRNRGIEATIGHLEGLWESDAPDWLLGSPDARVGDWRWTLLIALPEEASDEDVASAMAVARRKRPSPADARLVVMTIHEGPCVEAMHVGPYATEPETIERMRAATEAAGLRPHGAHHEIYLGDPRRSAPERLKTVLRHPVC
jgi:hypothetical protein